MKLKISLAISVVVVVIAIIVWNQKGSTMAHASDYQIDRNYYIVIDSNSAWFNVLVNGISVQLYNGADPFNITFPINHLMQSDKNQITYNFVSLLPGDHANDEGFGPTKDFSVHISIESIDLDTHERERITLVDARYDMETGQLVSNEHTIHGTEPVYRQSRMHTSGDLRLKEGFTFMDGEGPALPSQHLIAEFHTQDRFPRFHWLDEATVLEDTPELREGLRNAYRHIHDLMERGDFRGIRKLMDEGWKNAAITLNLGHTADDFLRNNETHKRYVKVRDDGSILKPLHFDHLGAPLTSDHIQFMDDGRVVRMLPDPIQWQRPGARNSTIASFVFYVTEEGEWKVAAIITG